MAEKQTFEVVLVKRETMEATGITIPFDVEKVFGAKRVPVKVSINGAEHRSTSRANGWRVCDDRAENFPRCRGSYGR